MLFGGVLLTSHLLFISVQHHHRPYIHPQSSTAVARHHRIGVTATTTSTNLSSSLNNDIIRIEKSTAAIMPTIREETIASVAKSLTDEVIDATEPSAERTFDILTTLQNETTATSKSNGKKSCNMTIAILESTKIGKLLTKTAKACKRHKRTSPSEDDTSKWNDAISLSEELLMKYKEAADEEAKQAAATKSKEAKAIAQQPGLPTSVTAYKQRLVSQSKELYKDPPALPPQHITIEERWVPLPKRNKTTGELTFVAGNDTSISNLLKVFHPNRTPEEVLRAGSFGGTYFRPITSAVTNISYNSSSVLKDTVESSWITNLDKHTMLTSTTYKPSINKFKVKCGGSLGMWESSGWISDSDPYGWFQWYCRFYRGRRSSDDARQISRWCKSAGVRGRFRSQICNKIVSAGLGAGDGSVSPVIRQTLLHWGLEVTEDVLMQHKKR
jgi:hypothetical protein